MKYSFFLKQINSAEIDIYKKIDLFSEVLDKINNEYVEEINQAEIMDSAINGLLQSLDPYSAYMNQEIFEEAQSNAKKIADKLDYVGTMCVEYFIDQKDNLLVNEIAPRVHNSGHLTINAFNIGIYPNKLEDKKIIAEA